MTRFVLTLMLVVAVCIHPAIHLVAELGRMFGGSVALPEMQPAPTEGAKEAATKHRQEAIDAAQPAAKLLDVAGEFLAAMDDRGEVENGKVMFRPRPELKSEPRLNELVTARQSDMKGLVIAREKLVEEKGKDKLDDLVRGWLVSCNESQDGFANPDKAIESLEKGSLAYRELVQKWEAKKLPLGEEAAGLAKRWEAVRIAFGKLKTKPATDRLVALAKLHDLIDESDRSTLREVAQNWVEKWLPKGDLALDPNVEIYDDPIGKWESVKRDQLFVVWSSRPNEGDRILYEPHKGKFAEFDLSSGDKISHFSRTKELKAYLGYKRIRPTEWSRVAHVYNRGRDRKDLWTVANLEKWAKECKPSEEVLAKWKDDEAPKKQKIADAYKHASALFDCLDKCKVLFPNKERKQP